MWILAAASLLSIFAMVVVALYFWGPRQHVCRNTVTMKASPQQAFDAFTDFGRWKAIWKHMGEAPTHRGELAVGTGFSWKEPDGNVVEAEVTRLEPGEALALKLRFVAMDQGQDFELRFEPHGDGGAAVTMTNTIHLGRTKYRVMLPLMTPMLNAFYRGVLKRLGDVAGGSSE